MRNFSTRQLVFSAAAVALAMVTSMVKLFTLPMGGSVTLLSMLFIVLIGQWYGIKAGVSAGVAYGLLQFAIEPYFFTIPQVIVDYPLAFGALGLSGFFQKKGNGLMAGYLAGVSGRLAFSFLSGWIFFGYYAADYGMSAPLYSLAYNGSYLAAEAAVTLAVISLPPVKKALEHMKALALGAR